MNPLNPAPFVSDDLSAFRAQVRDNTLTDAVTALRRLTRTDRVRDLDPVYREAVADAVRAVEQMRAGATS